MPYGKFIRGLAALLMILALVLPVSPGFAADNSADMAPPGITNSIDDITTAPAAGGSTITPQNVANLPAVAYTVTNPTTGQTVAVKYDSSNTNFVSDSVTYGIPALNYAPLAANTNPSQFSRDTEQGVATPNLAPVNTSSLIAAYKNRGSELTRATGNTTLPTVNNTTSVMNVPAHQMATFTTLNMLSQLAPTTMTREVNGTLANANPTFSLIHGAFTGARQLVSDTLTTFNLAQANPWRTQVTRAVNDTNNAMSTPEVDRPQPSRAVPANPLGFNFSVAPA